MPTNQDSHRARPASANCRACLFKSHCLPADLSGAELANFEAQVVRSPRPMKPGHSLVRQGDVMDMLYAVRRGAVKVTVDDYSNRAVAPVIDFHFSGTVIGLSQLDRTYWGWSVVSMEDTWFCRIPLHILDDSVNDQLIRLLSLALRNRMRHRRRLTSKTHARRIAAFLIEMAESADASNSICINLIMQYRDLAGYLGMRKETVSRLFRDLSQRGLVVRHGRHLRIPDMQALRDYAED